MAEGSSSHVSMETGNYRIRICWQNRINDIKIKISPCVTRYKIELVIKKKKNFGCFEKAKMSVVLKCVFK